MGILTFGDAVPVRTEKLVFSCFDEFEKFGLIAIGAAKRWEAAQENVHYDTGGPHVNLQTIPYNEIVRGLKKRLGCNAGHQEVSKCRTIGESGESIAHKQGSMQARGSSLAWKLMADLTRSPIQGYQWPHKKE